MVEARTRSKAPVRNPVLRKLFSNRLALVGGVILALLALGAVFAPWLSPYSPTQTNFTALQQPPSSQHLLGTDELGRDILSRILYGARVSLVAGLVSVSLALVLGGIIGLVAGFYGGWLDNLLMRLTDAMLAFPFLVLAIALAAVLGPSLQNTLRSYAVAVDWTFFCVLGGECLAKLLQRG